MQRRSWAELSPGARAGVVAAGTVQLGLLVAAQTDLARRDPREVRGPRWVWALVSLVNFVGPITYFSVGRRHPGPAGRLRHRRGHHRRPGGCRRRARRRR